MTLQETEFPVNRDGLAVIPRKIFCNEFFVYKAGEHLLAGGPTQRGKSRLIFDCLGEVANPRLPAYVAVSKPRDKVTEKYGKELGYRRVDKWPVPKTVGELVNGPPPGYLIWPKLGNLDTDLEQCAAVTKSLLEDRYTAGIRNKTAILVMDDTLVKSKILGLDKQMVTILAMAGAMGVGQWVAIQKPTDSGRTAIWAFGASEHIFLFRDPDLRNRMRYDEIGGVDPKFVAEASKHLGNYQALYLKRTGSYMCVVDSK
jgi:hypothetical protein